MSLKGRFVADIESDGLYREMTVVHSLCFKDLDTGKLYSCTDHRDDYMGIEEGLRILADAELVIFHNGIQFDVPALKKVYPWWSPKGIIRDTLLYSRVLWSDIKDADFAFERKLEKKGKEWIPKQFYGQHGLKAWGYRLGVWKGDYSDDKKAEGRKLYKLKGEELTRYVWATWNQEMQDYCDQDVEVTEKLWHHILKKMESQGVEDPLGLSQKPGADMIQLEHAVATIIARQQVRGFQLNVEKAEALYAKIQKRKIEVGKGLVDLFAPWYRNKGRGAWKKTSRVKRHDLGTTITRRRFSEKTGKELKPYVGPVQELRPEGAPFCKVELVPFNPGSRHDIADRLMKKRGWKPVEYSSDGTPKTGEEILSALPYPEAQKLVEYATLSKLTAYIADGKEAWLKHVSAEGFVHGDVNTNGAVSGRMTHSKPNIPQVPSNKVEYGYECRDCFEARKGFYLLGCDADGLELRDLAGYMARYDAGAYIDMVLNGDKKLGTDMHTRNSKSIGVDRDTAKTWFYAFIYGSGDLNLGLTLGATGNKGSVSRAGKRARMRVLKDVPALAKLVSTVKHKAKTQGFLKGLDGRRLRVRKEHSALNTLLQSAGAIQMKRALVILDEELQRLGFAPGLDYEFVANVHDEWQIEVAEHLVTVTTNEDGEQEYDCEIAQIAEDAIRKAGEFYDFACPLAGNADIGKTWAETH